jgi:rhamnogalacturonyl hydrolase YesR
MTYRGRIESLVCAAAALVFAGCAERTVSVQLGDGGPADGPAADGGTPDAGVSDGGYLVLEPPAAWQKERAREYLAHACAAPLNTGSPPHIIAYLECERTGLGPAVPPGAVPENAFDGIFDKLWRLRDTSDFDVNRLINLVYSFGGHPAIPETLWKKIEDALLSFKYWYTDPTPERIVNGEPVNDMLWYWTENHGLIFRSSEYLAGQKFPDEVFLVSGLTGREQMARAREFLIRWLDERARWGFTEWHSDVYYNWDMNPLITLVEWADDPEIACRAAMVLDLVMLDVALHLHHGTFGATHGRSYIKDKPAAELEDTFTAAKFFFDDTALPWQGADSGATILFSRSQKYALPWVIRTIAKDDFPMTDRERMNLPIDERPPEKWNDPVSPPPYGLSWNDESDLPLWWSMSGFVTWPLLPMTFDVANKYNLWDGQFESLKIISSLVNLDQPTSGIVRDVHPLYQSFWRVIAAPLLEEVHTYTHRTRDYMLSSAQDYRKGSMGVQIHAWQATLSEHAVVFTTHPSRLPVAEGAQVPSDWHWVEDEEPSPGYWTGEGSLPRIGQHENVAIIIYAPQFAPKPMGLSQFDYRGETHAYFPHAHFDEVDEIGNWTFGRKASSYVALYSHRPTIWRTGQPEVFKNAGLPFDRVATGGPDNVWIVELGSEGESGSFGAFKTAVSTSAISVTPVPDAEGNGFGDGFDVVYESPSKGTVTFGWHAPLVVSGSEVPLTWERRYDNPYVKTRFNEARHEIRNGDAVLALDFEKPSRAASAPPEFAEGPLDFCDGTAPGTGCYARKRSEYSENAVLARAIADRFIAKYPVTGLDWNWEETVLMFGLHELFRVTGDTRYRDYYRAWIDRHIVAGYNIHSSDTCSPALLAALLHIEFGEAKYKAVVDDALDYLDNRALRTRHGGLNHLGTSESFGRTLWVDSLFMFGEFLTRWGEFTGDETRLDMIGEQFRIFTDVLQSDGGFYVHAWGWAGDVDTDIYWGRGNGWVTASGYDYLRARLVRGEDDSEVLAALKKQVAAIIETQDAASGMWWTVLNRPGETYLETSAGALFAYGMARAYRYGLLDDSVLPVIEKAMEGVRSRILPDENGKPKVTGVSGPTTAGTFSDYKNVKVADDLGYGVGAVILSLLETSGLR